MGEGRGKVFSQLGKLRLGLEFSLLLGDRRFIVTVAIAQDGGDDEGNGDNEAICDRRGFNNFVPWYVKVYQG